MLIEAFYILFFYFTGEFISYFIDGFIPGSVIGMVLLFLALAFKVDRKHGAFFLAGRCGVDEFARHHLTVLGCDRYCLRGQYHTRNCQRGTRPEKIGKGDGRK